eukprot:CAMPEP_0201487136 /NCGR_PEP_ID=MMETSP0151_2-20130828/11134_1 /ASSEMBLY_ACC=CAM_ASM_000257 /TAXON_ID=200890 /ORGANISM="Paramoeba atlantica, Strain 621/1 / CCAP 1560/9" /LENGTH=323 /DNA_ID=CAMNT_0047872113 /DNA_START=246 /DNA_END=1217 /DNA_ORIENTATION=-
MSFHQIGIDAELLYDSEEMKPVDFVRVRPMEVKTRFTKDSSEAVVVSTIRVLSSQHEDMFFRISYTCLNRETGKEIPGLSLISPPVKVISKPEQLNKPKERQKRKRPLNQEIVDQLQRIEQHQMEYKAMLRDIATKVSSPLPDNSPRVNTISNMFSGLACGYDSSPANGYSSPVGSPDSSCGSPGPISPLSSQSPPPSPSPSPSPSPRCYSPVSRSPEADFQYHLEGLVNSVFSFAPQERPTKVRKLLQETEPETSKKARDVGRFLQELSQVSVPSMEPKKESTALFDSFVSSEGLSDSYPCAFEPFPTDCESFNPFSCPFSP